MAKIQVSFPVKKMLDALKDIERKNTIADEKAVLDTAEYIAKEAKKRAPVDTGELEKNIRVQRRTNLRVDVVNDVVSDVGFGYGAFLHESPSWELGEKSKEKQAGQNERVGNKWLERAFTENVQETKATFVNSVRRNQNF